MTRNWVALGAVVLTLSVSAARGQASQEVSVTTDLPTQPGNHHYVVNRGPLRAIPLVKLPVGAVTPRGWLKKQLELQAAGFLGRLGEISRWLTKDGNAWLSPTGEGHSNWEELPYWLKGFGDMAYVLGDEKLIAEAQVWLEGTLGSQREDGYFGPRANLSVIKTDHGDKPDLWPNMVMLNALQSYHEWLTRRDPRNPDAARIIAFLQRYFRWQLEYPEKDFLLPFWQQQRGADNLASVYWLYNRTGEEWLLELGRKIHRRTANWTDGVANWHGVNIAQSFRGPSVYWQQSGDERLLKASQRDYDEVMGLYGQVPGGMFGADENCRRGMGDPRQAAESCTMVEFMYSFEQLLGITGDPLWADRCEEIAFNSLPAAMTADYRALRYLTAPNMISSDARSKAPGYENAGAMQLFDPRDHRCCQHNVAHGWPYFCEHLWMATHDDGLAAVLHAPGAVTATVGDGVEVTIVSETHYPFTDKLDYVVHLPRAARFPLYFRVPKWCSEPATLLLNETEVARGEPGRYFRAEREWRDGDRLQLRLPMAVTHRVWTKNHDATSIHRGPLTYSLAIPAKVTKVRPDDPWCAYEVMPAGPWNYGLSPDPASGKLSVVVDARHEWPADDQPFAYSAAPVTMTVAARKIPNWREDYLGLVGLLQPSPARTDEPVESVKLIPMGCARLRITAFPTASGSSAAAAWKPPPQPKPGLPASASHCWQEDTLTALSDEMEPGSSDDYNVPRFTWWPRRGSAEWVQYDFDKPRTIAKTSVYWFDDAGRGRCRVPASWKLMYKPIGAAGGEEWRPVRARGEFGTERDAYNGLEFEPVETTAVRIEVQLRPEFSGGILEWRVE